MAATLLFARRSAPVVPGPLDEALWYARALGWAVLPGRDVPAAVAATAPAGPATGPAAGASGARLTADTGPAAGSPACAGRPGRSVGDVAASATIQPTDSARPTTNGAGQGAAPASALVRQAACAAQPLPSAYPTSPAYRTPGRRVRGCGSRGHTATTDPDVILRWWHARPRRAVRLATGVRFDVLDVPGAAGARVLRRAERLGLPLGPVAATTSGRVRFFVAPGVAEDLPAMLDWLDWSGVDLDLRAYGTGSSVSAPSPWPTTWLAPWPRAWESSRWLRAPAGSRLRCAGDAGPESLLRCDVRFADVTRLLSGLADACQQVRLLPAQRAARGRA
ncbi:bifunctional DNA primase/polymerase [Yinghuangia sp. ASG 101]|uniref:bifunctional DNA primase/polymerase n=1 Tax=Yinghuangia sp. ASG 101 TaxID=2896848 RepID=UPI001E4CB60A|nr:bifunctional DNA primase/polymerase [Yinghuangia sp. ASG 101]UGQ09196.1 bifunctional DNA primase/polymerase [Yinghuangia sp. ASG 101]